MSTNENEGEPLLQDSGRTPSSPERRYDSTGLRNEEACDANSDDPVVCEEVEVVKKHPQYFAALSASLSAFAAGIVLAWTSPISSDLEDGKYHNISVSASQMGWIGSFSTLGALVMCIPTGFMCDILGRKAVILSLTLPFNVGWSLLIWGKTLSMLYYGRFITGLAVGACCVAVPLYTSEIAQKEVRGALGSFFQLMITVGVFFAYVIGKFCSPTHYTMICGLVPLVAFLVFLFQPETPLYHVKKGNMAKAREALVQLRGPNCNVDIELNSIESGLRDSSRGYTSIMTMVKQRATMRAFSISFGLMFFQQFSGINAIIFYTSDIFQMSGVKFDPKTATILVGGFQAAATFVSSLIVDKLGRVRLLVISGAVMTISSLLLGIFDTMKEEEIINGDNIATFGALPVISLCVFVVVFSLGYGPIPWMMSAEIFTPEIKSVAASIAGTFNWFLAFLITKFYLDVSDQIGADKTFYCFSLFSMLGVAFVAFWVVETKGKTTGQIQAELGR